jgi:arsenate reductase
MEKIIIWHNPKCRKSREGLQYLKEKGYEPKIFEYLKDEIDPNELIKIIKLSKQPLGDFIRRNEKEFKELGLKDKQLSVEEFAKIVVDYPKLLERPIVLRGTKALIGRPASKLEEIF